MTAFNRENYISEAINSVLASSYKNFELIIVDDCSKDGTVAIAKNFQIRDARIKIFTNEKNLGDYKNRNIAASFATGKYLKYLDSDDVIYPWGLSAMVYCMETHPTAMLGLSSNTYIHEKYRSNYRLQNRTGFFILKIKFYRLGLQLQLYVRMFLLMLVVLAESNLSVTRSFG